MVIYRASIALYWVSISGFIAFGLMVLCLPCVLKLLVDY